MIESLKITIAENMDYDTAFNEVFNKYTKRAERELPIV